jgi:L-threonine kinase
VGTTRVAIRHWSDLDVGKGMGSSTADVLAAVRALANAVGGTLSPCEEGELAAKVESSDGTMHVGIAAVNHRTCRKVREWTWFPEFAIVMLVPHDSVDTDSISFAGQEALATEYAQLLANLDDAVFNRDIAAFAAQATTSSLLNSRFLLNPYAGALAQRLEDFKALGVNVGHTGTVCGLLFPNTDAGRILASRACFEARRQFPELKDVKVVTTPHWSPTVTKPRASGAG